MTFVTDKEELKPGLIVFRRGDVLHSNWYCRIRLPRADRYKTISLQTADIIVARERALDHDVDLQRRFQQGARPFGELAIEYLETQRRRAGAGEISDRRVESIKSIIVRHLNPYVGAIPIVRVSQEYWLKYPAWRRANGMSRLHKQICESTIYSEMAIFNGVLNYAVKRGDLSADLHFNSKPKYTVAPQDALSLQEYRLLLTTAQNWVAKATKPVSRWGRTVAYNFMLIMCNTGMRPSEARNLRWRDVLSTQSGDGRPIIVLSVRGREKSRKVVATPSVGKYLDRIRAITKAAEADDPVFTSFTGVSATTLYGHLIRRLLKEAGLYNGPSGTPRSIYCFRHTYAAFRLSNDVSTYFLAIQMGTSVRMIEEHYGYVNAIRYASRVLRGTNPCAENDEENMGEYAA